MIARRAVVRLIGATVTGLAILSGSIPAVGAAGPNASPNASPERAASVLPFATGDTGLELTLTKVSPAAVGPDDEVVITGSVRNLDSVARKNVRISRASPCSNTRTGPCSSAWRRREARSEEQNATGRTPG